jgi:hypothetical protein
MPGRAVADTESVGTAEEEKQWKVASSKYQAKQGGVTLHTWTEVQGGKKASFYITRVPGTPVPGWFRAVLRQKQLADIAAFPSSPSCLYDKHVLEDMPSRWRSA